MMKYLDFFVALTFLLAGIVLYLAKLFGKPEGNYTVPARVFLGSRTAMVLLTSLNLFF